MGNLNIVFKKNMDIGAASAEQDSTYLQDCFIDTGDFEVLNNIKDSHSVIVGRTGVGKSALIETLKNKEDHVLDIEADALCLQYISNSDILRFLDAMGVNLDIFYQLLWRHILSVELIKYKFKIKNEEDSNNFFSWISALTGKNKKKEKALDYIRSWGDKFWIDTDERIKEFTSKLERELSVGADLSSLGIPIDASAASKLSAEKKTEVIVRAQKIVSSVQIQELNSLMQVLADDVFDDRKNYYFITIDRLDENWVDERIKYRLIRSLIETIKKFRRVEQVKIVIALRADLLLSVIRNTKDAGFQEEKYEDLYIHLTWDKTHMLSLVDKRITSLFQDKYTKERICFSDVFAGHIGTEPTFDYMLNRTLMRPRDIILFVNQCIKQAQGQNHITAAMVRSAETLYSKKRLLSLCEEWAGHYPKLQTYLTPFEGKPSKRHLNEFSRREIEDLASLLLSDDPEPRDELSVMARALLDSKINRRTFTREWIKALQRVGAIGVKSDSYSPVLWSHEGDLSVEDNEIKTNTVVYLHPILWSALGIHERTPHV